MKPSRSDRTPGNRGAYEAARLRILKTQTICGICGKPVDFSYKNPHPPIYQPFVCCNSDAQVEG